MSWTTVGRYVSLEEIESILVEALGPHYRVSRDADSTNVLTVHGSVALGYATVRVGWIGQTTTLKVNGMALTSHRVHEALRHHLDGATVG